MPIVSNPKDIKRIIYKMFSFLFQLKNPRIVNIFYFCFRYLRENPVQKDGSHLKDFLFGKETWEDYLSRMEKKSTWGDHLTLKALSEVVGETIVVFNPTSDDVRRTEIVPSASVSATDTPFFLGHIGEYHYLSLRPMNWEKKWPIRKLSRSFLFAILCTLDRRKTV